MASGWDPLPTGLNRLKFNNGRAIIKALIRQASGGRSVRNGSPFAFSYTTLHPAEIGVNPPSVNLRSGLGGFALVVLRHQARLFLVGFWIAPAGLGGASGACLTLAGREFFGAGVASRGTALRRLEYQHYSQYRIFPKG